ncbi:MAG TPA: MaoC family dehydratase [Hyphomicrobiales bacterium]|nr:MaoC family dehydratase [Rhodobiaceae bacterium]HXK53511.1 MaoC family dehydratase [Hyphomicrobiales bacterium]
MDAEFYFEDFHDKETVTFPGSYEVEAEEIKEFASRYDPQPMHLDEEAGAKSMLGGLSASGWHTCAIAMRLMCDGYLTRSAGMSAPGVEEVKWLRPVRAGDVLRMDRSCLSKRMSKSRPNIGMCRFEWVLKNQHGDAVLDMIGTQMFLTRASVMAGLEDGRAQGAASAGASE